MSQNKKVEYTIGQGRFTSYVDYTYDGVDVVRVITNSTEGPDTETCFTYHTHYTHDGVDVVRAVLVGKS